MSIWANELLYFVWLVMGGYCDTDIVYRSKCVYDLIIRVLEGHLQDFNINSVFRRLFSHPQGSYKIV